MHYFVNVFPEAVLLTDYRLRDAWKNMGYTSELLEWPEQGQGYLPKPDIQCTFQWLDQGRNLIVLSHSPVGEQILDQIEW